MNYVDIYNEIDRWREELRHTHAGDAVVRAIEERIARESDPMALEILAGILVREHIARGDHAAADVILGRDPIYEIDRWYKDLRREASSAEIISALEERIRNESDPRKLHALRFHLLAEHKEHGSYQAAEAVALADIAANPDEPNPLIWLAGQKFYYEDDPQAALAIIDRAIAVAMRCGLFRRQALATKGRIAIALQDHGIVEDVLRQIMALTFTPGNQDIGAERDILDCLPPGSIDSEVARAYDEYCRARGKTRTHQQQHLDELVIWAARPDWRKVAMIIAKVLNACEHNAVATSEEAIIDSIRLMVEQGKLEAQGDLSRPRYSEVRLPDHPGR